MGPAGSGLAIRGRCGGGQAARRALAQGVDSALEILFGLPISLVLVQQSKGGGLMSHCHMPFAALVSVASAETRA